MYQRPFFNKVAGMRPLTLLKKSFRHSCFPANIVRLFRTPFFVETTLRKNEILPIFRSSPSHMFFKIGVLKNFQIS